MRQIGEHVFPESFDDVRNWTPNIVYRSLARRVVAVASTRVEGTWAAYIDAVPGANHQFEYKVVLSMGTKLPPREAYFLFPEFADLPYAL